jgi:hypothetical protein
MPATMQDAEARRQKIRETLKRRLEEREDAQPDKKAPEPPAQHGEQVHGGRRDVGAAAPETGTAQRPDQAVAPEAPRTDETTSESVPERATEPAKHDLPPPSAGPAPQGGTPASSTAKTKVEPLQREAELMKKELEEKLQQLDEAKVNHLSEHEPDARMMKGRGMSAMGYNAQIVVDHESDLIVAENVVADQNDVHQLTPMLEHVEATLGRVADQTVADTGYDNSGQLKGAESQKMNVIVSLRDEPEIKGKYRKSLFRYDAQSNVYICPQDQQLMQIGTNKAHATQKHPDALYHCRKSDCPVRARCTDSPQGRQIRRPYGEDARERQADKQQDPRMRLLLGLRKEIVEHLFGIVKTIDGFRRFTVRGLEKVNAQWALVCMGVNLRKLSALATWQNGKLVPRAARLAAATS